MGLGWPVYFVKPSARILARMSFVLPADQATIVSRQVYSDSRTAGTAAPRAAPRTMRTMRAMRAWMKPWCSGGHQKHQKNN
jgi:hypothetical protein